jgi:steroid delta-isomerase-like uncharacterized protein
MTREQAIAFFQRREASFNRHDVPILTADHTDDGTIRSPLFPSVRGRAAIAASYKTLFTLFPDWQMSFEPLIVDEARIAQPFTARATHVGELMGLAGSGRRFEIHGALIHRIEDGLIAEERRIYDFTALLMQLGILKVKAAS